MCLFRFGDHFPSKTTTLPNLRGSQDLAFLPPWLTVLAFIGKQKPVLSLLSHFEDRRHACPNGTKHVRASGVKQLSVRKLINVGIMQALKP